MGGTCKWSCEKCGEKQEVFPSKYSSNAVEIIAIRETKKHLLTHGIYPEEIETKGDMAKGLLYVKGHIVGSYERNEAPLC